MPTFLFVHMSAASLSNQIRVWTFLSVGWLTFWTSEVCPNVITTPSVSSSVELVLKVRIQNPSARENDFIEVELDRQELTYRSLLRVCCRELEISAEHVEKIRKLPNTMLRKVREKWSLWLHTGSCRHLVSCSNSTRLKKQQILDLKCWITTDSSSSKTLVCDTKYIFYTQQLISWLRIYLDSNMCILLVLFCFVFFLSRTRTLLGCRIFRSWKLCWRKQRACPFSLGLGAWQTDPATTWRPPASPTKATTEPEVSHAYDGLL